jgi:hypothetical protein
LLLSEAFPGVSTGKIEPYFEILYTMVDVFPKDTVFMAGHGRALNMAELMKYTQMMYFSTEPIIEALWKGKTVDEMLAENILAKWSEYGECPFLPYQTQRVWISAVARTHAMK